MRPAGVPHRPRARRGLRLRLGPPAPPRPRQAPEPAGPVGRGDRCRDDGRVRDPGGRGRRADLAQRRQRRPCRTTWCPGRRARRPGGHRPRHGALAAPRDCAPAGPGARRRSAASSCPATDPAARQVAPAPSRCADPAYAGRVDDAPDGTTDPRRLVLATPTSAARQRAVGGGRRGDLVNGQRLTNRAPSATPATRSRQRPPPEPALRRRGRRQQGHAARGFRRNLERSGMVRT